MNLFDDKKLETFLKENRPLHPRHSERECERIWQRAANENQEKFLRWPQLAYGFAATLAAFSVLYFTWPQLEPKASLDEVALVDDSLELKFLENGDIYEVSDLLSLSK